MANRYPGLDVDLREAATRARDALRDGGTFPINGLIYQALDAALRIAPGSAGDGVPLKVPQGANGQAPSDSREESGTGSNPEAAPFPRAIDRLNRASEAMEQIEAELRYDRNTFRNLVDRALKMMVMAGYGVVSHNDDHNNPIVAWMADARESLGVGRGLQEGK